MIQTSRPIAIDFQQLHDWFVANMRQLLPDVVHISIIPHRWQAVGESRFFAVCEPDKAMTLEDVLRAEILPRDHDLCAAFYVTDVVAAAIGAGELTGFAPYWVYATW